MPIPQQQDAPGTDKDLKPHADHGEESYHGSGKLSGQVAVITGGDSGIGRAVAIAFAREGADVAIGFLSEKEDDDARETVKWVEQAGRRCLAHRFNVQYRSECEAFVDRAVKELGRLDIVVNNAAYQRSSSRSSTSPRNSSTGPSGRTSMATSSWCRPRCRT